MRRSLRLMIVLTALTMTVLAWVALENWYVETNDVVIYAAVDVRDTPAQWIEIQKTLMWTYTVSDVTDPDTGKITAVMLESMGFGISGTRSSFTWTWFRKISKCPDVLSANRHALDKYR